MDRLRVGEKMLDKIKALIESHDTIVIHRHKDPDYDALGSQNGLKYLIKDNYPSKKVYALGKDNEFKVLPAMDTVDDSIFKKALGIVLDVSQSHRIDDERVLTCENVIVIDHHQNGTDCADYFYHDSEAIAVSEMIANMARAYDWELSEISAKALMMGIISDSGRFLYKGVRKETFEAAMFLMEIPFDLDEMYQSLYSVDLNYKRARGYALNQFVTTPSGIAILRNTKEVKNRFKISEFAVSRGLVSTMSQIKGIEIWVNFTETDDEEILCELRSSKIFVDDIARKYEGGGHHLAAGCILKTWNDTENLIKDIERKIHDERT
jgi:phosphoesterase RecJ-like protein